MSDNSVAAAQIKELKRKLDAAIKSRAVLEEGFNAQSSQLIQFIGKLSQVCKGIDLKLDNKLADFRTLLTKSAPLAEIEIQINEISTLLLQHSSNNDKNIKELHQQFHAAGKILQKIKGLPPQLRRNLRSLMGNNKDTKEAVIQYVPLLTELVNLYESALKAKVSLSEDVTVTDKNELNLAKKGNEVNLDILRKFSQLLDKLKLSEQQNAKIQEIRQGLNKNISNKVLIEHFMNTFDLILMDLKTERDSAESFLLALNQTLSKVQHAVKNTLFANSESQKIHHKLNNQLQHQINDMTHVVEKTISLSDVKGNIQDKLQLIANTIESKTQLEVENQKRLKAQLQTMAGQISALEKQSENFEARLKEQQRKNMQDALTKLNNRAAFDEHFAKEMVRFHQNKFDLAIAVIDIDNFKKINDTYGHTAGDRTLQVIAKTIKSLQSNDIFSARYGGEEFVLVFSKTKKPELLKSLTWLCNKIASLPFKFKQDRVTITLSIGATHIHKNDNIHQAFERADKGLYQAKNSGKNKVIYL